MKIRIADISPDGRDISFELPKGELNARLELAHQDKGKGVVQPKYTLKNSPEVHLHLELEGSTVVAKGDVKAEYLSPCARCAEETSKSLEVPIDIVLKHASARNRPGAEEEDLHLSYYEGLEIDCGEFSADLLFLGLPYTVLCQEACRGLCPQCGKNLNLGPCDCKPDKILDPRLSVLGQIKLTH